MFFDSELEIYYDLLKNDQILLQCVCFGPASPDAGVELLRQLFLQCLITRLDLIHAS